MVVLTILGMILVVILIYLFVIYMNEYTFRMYKYSVYNQESFIASAIAYTFLFFGRSQYLSALTSQGDILNGILLGSIGIVILIGVIIYNIKKTSILTGILFSLLQIILYVPFSIIGVFVVIVGIAILLGTKPVYVINK